MIRAKSCENVVNILIIVEWFAIKTLEFFLLEFCDRQQS